MAVGGDVVTQQAPTGRGTGPASPSAATVLEVADGLRWQDPNLSAALAEHAVRLAGDDAALRGAAERSAVRALGELDQPGVVVARAVPQLEAAVTDRRPDDAAALRFVLVGAALQSGDATAARGLLDAALAEVSPRSAPELRGELELRTAQVLAVEADVSGADAAVRRAEAAVSWTAGAPASSASALDLVRARATARRASGDVAGAVALLGSAAPTGVAGTEPDGGRRALLVIVDLVCALLDLGDAAGARARAAGFLHQAPGPTTALPLGQLRCSVAGRIHLPARELDAADAVARTAEADLSARGHDAVAATACEIVASVAEARGDLAAALAAVRRAHALEMRAVEEQHRVRRALAGVLVTAAASPPVRARSSSAGQESRRYGGHAPASIAAGPVPVAPTPFGADPAKPGDARVRDAERPFNSATGSGTYPSVTSGAGGTKPGSAGDAGAASPGDGAAPEEDAEVLAALEAAVAAAGIRRGGRRRRSETVDEIPSRGSNADGDGSDPLEGARSSLFDTSSTASGRDAPDAPAADLDGGPVPQEPGTLGVSATGDGSSAADGFDGHRSTGDHDTDGAVRVRRDRPVARNGTDLGDDAGTATSRLREDAGDRAVDRNGDRAADRGAPGGARPEAGGRIDDERGAPGAAAPGEPSSSDGPWWRSRAGRGGGTSSSADLEGRPPALESFGTVDVRDPLSASLSWDLDADQDGPDTSVPRATRGGGPKPSPLDRSRGAEPAGDEHRSALDERGAARRGAAVERGPGVHGGGHRGDESDPLFDPDPEHAGRGDDAIGLGGSVGADREHDRGVDGGLRATGPGPARTTVPRGGREIGPVPDAGPNGLAGSVPRVVEDEPAGDRRPERMDEEAEDLALTLASLLAEYDVPSGSVPAPSAAHPASGRAWGDGAGTRGFDGRGGGGEGVRRGNGRSGDQADAGSRGAVPTAPPGSARTAGSAHVDHRPGAYPGIRARGAGPDSGARLADLLAEAMDAFRRTGPGADDHGDRPVMRRG